MGQSERFNANRRLTQTCNITHNKGKFYSQLRSAEEHYSQQKSKSANVSEGLRDLVNYNSADDQFWQPGKINILLGISAYTQIIKRWILA